MALDSASRRARWFACLLIALPCVAVAFAFWLAGTTWFLHHGLPAYMSGLDSEYGIRNQNCDILIFGDSSALTGIEPRLVSQQTGMRVCGVARTKGETGVTGTGFLDWYLRHNPAPRAVVLAFAPEDWHPAKSWNEVAYAEGVTQLVRHYPKGLTLWALIKRPDNAFGYVTFVYKQAFAGLRHRARGDAGVDPSRDFGHMTLPKPAETACTELGKPGMPVPYFAPDEQYMARLREKYSANNTRVVLVVSPVPDCDPLRDKYLAALQPYVDVTFPAYPIGDFNDIDRHFTRAGSARYSADLSRALAGMGLAKQNAEAQ